MMMSDLFKPQQTTAKGKSNAPSLLTPSIHSIHQETLKFNLETPVVPGFQLSYKAMREQMDVGFKKGMVEHTTAALEPFETQHLTVTPTLKDTMNSLSSAIHTLSGELAEAQSKLIESVAAGLRALTVDPLVTKPSDSPLSGLHDNDKVKAPLDPTEKLSKLISERKYEEAFIDALERRDVMVVSWLCSQVGLQKLLLTTPLPLSQQVLLSLLHQLACDIHADTPRKLAWMTDVAVAIDVPIEDPIFAKHARPFFDQIYWFLSDNMPTVTAAQVVRIQFIKQVIYSVLTIY